MKKKAFTLIELLIVVAIIAILAAIAVPNFLEAQTRSKISRVKADMRTVAVGCESYRVDNTHMFPVERTAYRYMDYTAYANQCHTWWLYILWEGPVSGTGGPIGEPNPSALGAWITSPVSYLASIPIDPFFTAMMRKFANDQWGRGVLEASCLYYGPETGAIFGWPMGANRNVTQVNPQYPDAGFGLFSCGADLVLDYAPVYDPTNGTVSRGDIVYFGRGIGYVSYLR